MNINLKMKIAIQAKALLLSIGTALTMFCMWLVAAAVYPPTASGVDGSIRDDVYRKRHHRLQTRNTTLSVNQTVNATNSCTNNRCMHNSTCIIDAMENTHCNCTAAKVDNRTQFAGKYCEYEATSTCIREAWYKDHFCVNNGTCISNSYPPSCDCQLGYYGKHCEFSTESAENVDLENDDDDDAIFYIAADDDPLPTPLPVGVNYYCGTSLPNAEKGCSVPCRTGEDIECIQEVGIQYKCFATTGCAQESSNTWAPRPPSPTVSPYPTMVPTSPDHYCGSSPLDARVTCRMPCTSATDAECVLGLGSGFRCYYVPRCAVENEISRGPSPSSSTRVPSNSTNIYLGHSQISEYDALVFLYRVTDGLRWTRNDGWLSNLNICVWYGVKCNTESNVTSLVLSSNGMAGTLSNDFLGGLPHLESIIFDNNGISGSIPADIGYLNLTKLKTLNLRSNNLRGTIPSGLGVFSLLEELDLRSNSFSQFQGPEYPHGYSNLRSLLLDDNNLDGTLIYHVASMKKLELLSIRGNRVVGDIPQDFSSLVNLTTLDLSYNDISGTLPTLDFEYLNISIVGNRLAGIHPDACLMSKWNNGDVGRYGCDGIACSIGTANSAGRRTPISGPCSTCSSARFIGTVGCDKGTPSPSPISVLTCGIHCVNGGVCSMGTFGPNEWCDCPQGFAGTRCELQSINYRPSPPPSRPWDTTPGFDTDCTMDCQNGGVCLPGLIEMCRCPSGFEGRLCQVQYYQPTPPPYYITSRPSSKYYYTPSPPPSPSSTSSHHYYGSADCLFYAINEVGRLTSFPSFCGGGAGYADLLRTTTDITVDPVTFRGIAQRGSSMYEFDIKDGSIGERFAAKLEGVGVVKSVFNAIELANGKFYGVGSVDTTGDTGNQLNSNILYQMDTETMQIQARGPQFEVPIVGLARRSNDIMYAVSSCDTSNELYEIELNTKQARRICKELPVCIHSIAYHPEDAVLYAGMSDGCIGRIMTDSCVVLGCDTADAWHSHLDGVIAGLSVVCPHASSSPSMSKSLPSLPEQNSFFGPEDERTYLSKFFQGTSGPRWKNTTNWLKDVSKCRWHGISCDGSGNITSIELAQNGLVGDTEAMQYMSLLPHLRILNLSNNRIFGRLYTTSNVGTLELESLDLGGNMLSGTLPQNFLESSVNTLQYLDLSRNRFTGYLGWGIMYSADWDEIKWPSLKYLNLSSNSLGSSIPVEIGQRMLSLEYLDLSDNRFTFEFQESFYRALRNLTSLRLGRNNLVGELPSYEAVYYPRLQELDVSYNNMKGEIPNNLFNNDSIVNRTLALDISHNHFGFTFPSLELLPRLNVNAAGNMFEQIDEKACMNTEWNNGDVGRFRCGGLMCPPLTFNPLGRQTSAENPCLSCDTARFYGTTECNVITKRPTQQPVSASIKHSESEYEALISFYKYTDGPSWTRSDYWLSDVSICEWYGVRCGDNYRVTALILPSNNLKGPYDDGAKWLEHLLLIETLDLSDNNFSGDAGDGFFESRIGYNRRLSVINLRNNLLSGRLPILNGFPLLQRILLGNNSFSGTISSSYFDGRKELRELDLGANRLTGTLASFSDSPFLKMFNVSMNSLTGTIPTDFLEASFSTLTIFSEPYTLDLSFNLLEGTLPAFDVGSLLINVAANKLSSLDEEICEDRPSWNRRGVYKYGCDAVACAVGSANAPGRQTSELTSCVPCPDAIYIGSIDCVSEVTSTAIEGCPDCQNGATCSPPRNDAKDVGYTCDCEAASSTWFEVYAGELCQYKATQFCSNVQYVAKYSFCTNGGSCRETELTQGSKHPGCDCPEGFSGDHCEVAHAENQLTTEDLTSLTIEPSTLELTSHPSSSPIELPKTFQLYQIPRFVMTLTSEEAKAQDLLSLRDVEDVTSTFLLEIFEDNLGHDNSVYVTTLDASEIDPSELESSTSASKNDSVNITGTRRTQDEDNNLIFLSLDGIVGIRDGIFNGPNEVEDFIVASLGRTFQSRDELLAVMQAYPDPTLQSLSLIELSDEIEICPNDLRCHHGSQCVVSDDGFFACDCSVASSTYYYAVDGVQCEFAATQYCSNSTEMKKYAFCVNDGECVETNVTSGHPGCVCSEPYEGFRCQLLNELRFERSTGPFYGEDTQSSNDGLSGGDYAIIIIICLGFILTTMIIVHKMVNTPKTRLSKDKQAPNEMNASLAAEMEAGLGRKVDPPVPKNASSLEKIASGEETQQAPSKETVQPIPEDGNTTTTEERGLQEEQSDYLRNQASIVSAGTEGAVYSAPQQNGASDDGSEEEKEEIEPFHPDEDYTVCADVASQYTLSNDPGVPDADKDDQKNEAQEDVVLESDVSTQEDTVDETAHSQDPTTSKATTDHDSPPDSSEVDDIGDIRIDVVVPEDDNVPGVGHESVQATTDDQTVKKESSGETK